MVRFLAVAEAGCEAAEEREMVFCESCGSGHAWTIEEMVSRWFRLKMVVGEYKCWFGTEIDGALGSLHSGLRLS